MLELIDIKKRYGSKEVLHGISIKFENGIYGLIGPNGSGKSTIMNIMSDVLDMSSGKILYNGTDIKELDDRYREKIGFLPQNVGYYPNFTAKKTIEYFGYLTWILENVTRIPRHELPQTLDFSDFLPLFT